MLYSVLIYGNEAEIDVALETQNDSLLAQHHNFQAGLRGGGKLAAVVRLQGTDSAKTLRGGRVASRLMTGSLLQLLFSHQGFLMPNFFIRKRRVPGLMPNRVAAPQGPSTTQPHSMSTRRKWCLVTPSRSSTPWSTPTVVL